MDDARESNMYNSSLDISHPRCAQVSACQGEEPASSLISVERLHCTGNMRGIDVLRGICSRQTGSTLFCETREHAREMGTGGCWMREWLGVRRVEQ